EGGARRPPPAGVSRDGRPGPGWPAPVPAGEHVLPDRLRHERLQHVPGHVPGRRRPPGPLHPLGRSPPGSPDVGRGGRPRVARPGGRDPGGRPARHAGRPRLPGEAARGRVSRLRPDRPAREDGGRRARGLLPGRGRDGPRPPAPAGEEPGRAGLRARGRSPRRPGARGGQPADPARHPARPGLRGDAAGDPGRRRRPAGQPLAHGQRPGGAPGPLPHRPPGGRPYLTFPPQGFTLDWYRRAVESPAFMDSLAVSTELALAATALALAIGTPAAYAIDRHRFPGRALFQAFLLSPMIVPLVVLAI